MGLRNFFNVIILLGALQGLIVSSLLFFTSVNKQTNRVLGALILLISLASINLYGNYIHWFGSDLLVFIVQILPLVMVMAFGPLIFFYVQSTLDPQFRLMKTQWFHFIPVLVDFVPMLTIFIYCIGLITKLVTNNPAPWGIFIDQYNVYADIPRWLSVSIYVWLSRKYLSVYKLKEAGSMAGYAFRFRWLSQFLNTFVIFQFIWLLYLIPYVIPRYTDWVLSTFDWYPVYLPISVMIYWLGLKGYMISQQQVAEDTRTASANNPIAPDIIADVKRTLYKLMDEDKAYLNPALTLALVAQRTSFNQRLISTVLNQSLQKSFIEFINEYRVTEFKERVFHPDKNNLTIAGIALECGFSSQATFQRVFKNSTGCTPTQFISGGAPLQGITLKT